MSFQPRATQRLAQERQRRRNERLRHLPPFARNLAKNYAAANQFINTAPLVRMMVGAGKSPAPGMGIVEFDAMVAIIKDILGVVYLSDAEFEHALRLSTPPEFRETAQ